MDEHPPAGGRQGRPRKRLRVRLQRRLKTLYRSPVVSRLAGRAIYDALRFVRRTQRPAPGSSDFDALLASQHPAIVALWHGQHLLAPFFRPVRLPYVALLSRNADAEINAAVVERFGIETVRGSGGRVREAASRKGGARALIQLMRKLREGFGVCMIADVPKGVPREAGLGIVTLARLSGRPIVPSAAVTSRRRVLEKTWDRTTLPLPFGRIAVVMEDPIFVPADADAAAMEEIRARLTLAIERANRRAILLADGRGDTFEREAERRQ
ncbi:lysophospholipid acyltransferase family protein [Aureimonas sp. AU12]|uniref:lysophospholipid acyltransferase family protein n=1 Tax=Aureimonas sp. AU12 TaxID=1638161 RepID=UPI0007815680|nr:lysophospholipid acyltransferase family protein [Aureimonas sp. AU12]